MVNQENADIIKTGVEVWNKWVREHRGILPDLSQTDLIGADLSGADLGKADLSGADLGKADLSGADLGKADLSGADLSWADLSGADLSGAYLSGANLNRANLIDADLIEANLIGADLIETNLSWANLSWTDLSEANLNRANLNRADLGGADLSGATLSGADLGGADLTGADLGGADLSGVDLSGADLSGVSLIGTNLTNANLTGCRIFGISAWNVGLEGAIQTDLVITDFDEPTITVDNLEVAQFIYLLLNNAKIRDVISTIAKKVVLILGRFTDERKPVLDALRDELRKQNYSPVVFDFDPSAKRDLTETISTLAHLSRFIIADLNDTKSIPQELQAIVPHLPSVPIQPILQVGATEYAMFEHYERYPWVLPIYRYQDIPSLLRSVKEHIIKSVEQKEYEKEKNKALEEENRKLREEIEKLRGGK
jgi:uncharacterized protein YjbI with pentapeptide repeats